MASSEGYLVGKRYECLVAREVEMPKEPVEGTDDILLENFFTILFLLLGILAVFASLSLIAYSTTLTVSTRQLPADFLTTSIIVVLLFVGGFGSLHVFRRRRKLRKKKTSKLL